MQFTGVAVFHISTDGKAGSNRSPFLPWIPKLLLPRSQGPSTLFKKHLKSVQQDRQFTCNTPARSRYVCTSSAILTFYSHTALLWRFNITCQNKTYWGIHVKARHFCSTLTKFGITNRFFMKVPNIQLQENPSSGRHADTCGWTNRRNNEGNKQTLFPTMWIQISITPPIGRAPPHPITISSPTLKSGKKAWNLLLNTAD